MKNHISRAFWFTFFIILFLGALHYLPSLSIEGHTLRKVNILSDILKEEPEVALIDTLELPPPVKPAFVDTCKTGMTCIEDYADSTLFYGIAMESRKGISLDNFGLRSSSGLTLRSIPMKRLKQFNRLRPYDLIILQYGLNVATQKGYNYDSYQQGLLSTIEHLKKAFPDAGFLLIGVGDRAYKTEDGDMKTMPGIKNLIRYQQYIAAKAGIAFWNLYEAMGGEGSIEKMVHATPPQANLDYTHINFKGGKHLAKILYETLLYDKEQYDKRRAYEQE